MEGHPSRARRLTRAVVYGVVVAVPIGVLAFLVRTQFDPLVDQDQRVILAATDFTRSHPRFRSVAEIWELISQPWVMYLVLGVPLCLFAWFRLHLRTRAMWALATMATGWAVAVALKTVVQRARPVVEDPFAVHAGYSFPSGHTTNNAIVVTILLLLFAPVLGVTARRVLLAVGVLWVPRDLRGPPLPGRPLPLGRDRRRAARVSGSASRRTPDTWAGAHRPPHHPLEGVS